MVPSPSTDPAPVSGPGVHPPEEAAHLEHDWDDAFAWSYGRRLWNVGCA
jgi:hypothetical protein